MSAMFSTSRPYYFHIELTDKCNAGCPMCPRTLALDHCRTDPAAVFNTELTLADFRDHFTDDLCARIKQVVLSGNYGDPLAASDCLDICDYLTSRGVTLAISTNGSLRNTGWWEKLGHIMARTGSRVELHVDGLADTNPLYRINTSFPKIMANAEAYLATGAMAEWHYILFRHNEHQVEEAFELSRKLGFEKFVLIDTVRFGDKRFKYQMPDGEFRYLEASERKGDEFRFLPQSAPLDSEDAGRRKRLGNRTGNDANGDIQCKAMDMNRPFISARGQVSACCWVAGSDEEAALYRGDAIDMTRNNIRNRPLETILQDEPFANLYQRAWETAPPYTCNRKCREMRVNRRLFA